MADLVESNTADVQSDASRSLLKAAAAFDDAYYNADAKELGKVVAQDAVLHADHLTIENDYKGPEQISHHFNRYFTNYKFKHFPIVRAVNEEARSVYILWDDEDVIMRPEKFDEGLPASGNATKISGIWKLVINDSNLVKDIWFLRQFTREEIKHRLKYHPNQLYSDFSAKHYVGPALDLTEKQVQGMIGAAQGFNQVWKTGDVKSVHDIMKPGAHTINPIFGEKKNSREEWESMIQDVFQFWEVESNDVDIAVTPSSNKAFIHWHVRGRQKLPSSPRKEAPPTEVQENEMYGLNLLVFDMHDGKIADVVGFRQPLVSEHEHIFKAGPYLESLPEA